jgi:hypothetical protein
VARCAPAGDAWRRCLLLVAALPGLSDEKRRSSGRASAGQLNLAPHGLGPWQKRQPIVTLANLIEASSCPASENNPVVGQSVRDFFTAVLRRVGVAVLSQVRPCTAPRSRSSALGSLRH